jgi:hypothetical protein
MAWRSDPAWRLVVRTLPLCVGTFGAAASAIAQAPPTAFWDLSLTAQESWYSNPNLTQTSPAVFSTRAGVGLGYSRNSSRGRFSLSANAAAAFNNSPAGTTAGAAAAATAGNRLNYSGALAWQRQLGPRTSLQVSDSLTRPTRRAHRCFSSRARVSLHADPHEQRLCFPCRTRSRRVPRSR